MALRRHPYQHFADAVCTCGGKVFGLQVDDDEGAAVRTCPACGVGHPMGDSADYLGEAQLEECECPCGNGTFEITVGVALYGGSNDVRWVYVGCRCGACGQLGCYGDWKNEFQDYQRLLSMI